MRPSATEQIVRCSVDRIRRRSCGGSEMVLIRSGLGLGCRVSQDVVVSIHGNLSSFVFYAVGWGCSIHLPVLGRLNVLIFPFDIWIIDLSFQISNSPAIRAQKLRPCFVVIQDGTDAFIMPDVRTGRNEKRLTWLFKISEHPFGRRLVVLTAIDIRHIEHSDECADAVSESFFTAFFPKSRRRL